MQVWEAISEVSGTNFDFHWVCSHPLGKFANIQSNKILPIFETKSMILVFCLQVSCDTLFSLRSQLDWASKKKSGLVRLRGGVVVLWWLWCSDVMMLPEEKSAVVMHRYGLQVR